MTPFEQSLECANTITVYCCPFVDDDSFSFLSQQADSPVRPERRWWDPYLRMTITRTNRVDLFRQTCQTLAGPDAPEVSQELETMVFPPRRGSYSKDSGRNLIHFPNADSGGLLPRLRQMSQRPSFYSLGFFEVTTAKENDDHYQLRQPCELAWLFEFNVCFDLDPNKVRVDTQGFITWLTDWIEQTWQRSVLVTVDTPASPRLAWFFDGQSASPPAFQASPVAFKTWTLRASSRLPWLGQVGALQRLLQTGRRTPSRVYDILEQEVRDRAKPDRPGRLKHVGATFNQGRDDPERLDVAIAGPPQFLWRSFFPPVLEPDGDVFDDLEPPPGLLFAASLDGVAHLATVTYGLYHDNDPGGDRCLCGSTYPICAGTIATSVVPLRSGQQFWIQAQYANRHLSPPGVGHTWERLSSPHFYFGLDPATDRFDEEAATRAALDQWANLLAPGGPLGE